MKTASFIAISIVLIIIQSATLSFLPADFFKPDVGIPFIIYVTLFLGPEKGFIATLIIALFQEILSNSPPGSMIFTKVFIFLLVTFLKGKLFIDSKYSFSYICGGSVVVESFLFLILSLISKGEVKNVMNVLFYIVPNAIFTGFIAIFIFSMIEYINIKFLSRE